MGKKGKKSKKGKPDAEKKGPRITMQDLEEMSGSDGEMPPEEEWDEYAKDLKEQILGGAFDHLLNREDGGGSESESIEEVELNSEDDEHEMEQPHNEEEVDDESDEEDSYADDSESEKAKELDGMEAADVEKEEESDDAQDEVESEPERTQSSSSDEDNEDEEEDKKDSHQPKVEASIEMKNQFSSKALHLVTQELIASKKGMPWAETFDIVPSTPLPFGPASQGGNPLDIHDDLKREVAFYDLALDAVHQGRQKCQESGIAFTRPRDFFAEMVKSDDHMARVKDRLIFESKKMEAVAQRKSNKEHKLRAKEGQANKIAEKAKRKKDHFRAVEDWAQSAASKRGGRLSDNDNDYIQAITGSGAKKAPNKKRQYADKKYGFGGKRGRFKQNDEKAINDLSSYNPRGNFEGGMKKTKSAKGSGAKRKGKRARDASRSRRS